MKIEGTRKSSTPNQHTLYIISFGKQEIEVLQAVLEHCNKEKVRTSENNGYTSRLGTLNKQISQLATKIKREEL